MVSQQLHERLLDPAYLDLHLAAVGALRQADGLGWYDSQFLRAYQAACLYLGMVRPESLPDFRAAFDVLQPVPGHALTEVVDFLPASQLAQVRREIASLLGQPLERHELDRFGRLVLHDHPPFLALQAELTERVSQLAGRPLEAGYSFLSLYGPQGRCPMHMDQPISMYTLDLCIDQSTEWPIHFSKPIDWRTIDRFGTHPTRESLDQAGLPFSSHVLRPNGALLFCGSAQWHYRDPIPPGGYCHLLFFHYFPAGCGRLINPADWARHFALAELQPLCDLFRETGLTPHFESEDAA